MDGGRFGGVLGYEGPNVPYIPVDERGGVLGGYRYVGGAREHDGDDCMVDHGVVY